MDHLILLTAAFRGSNLPIIAKSIGEAVTTNKYVVDNNLEVHWLVCADLTHWRGENWFTLWGKLKDSYNNFHIHFRPVQSSGDKAYGGDIYNEPLTEYVHDHALNGNPWIYILDDDNILHPNVLKYVVKVNQSFIDKEIIWLTNMQRTGRIDGVINEDYAMQYTKSGSFFMNFPDPSTTIYRFQLLNKYGLYATGGGSDYDRSTFVPMIGGNLDKCVFATDLDTNLPHPSVQKVHAYHDGLRTEDEFEEDFQSFERGYVEVCNFRIQTLEGRFPTQYHVPPELGEMILHMIKVYYDQHEMTGHISRGTM